MRIVIDMQGAQTESRFRGIGRYTLSLVRAMLLANHTRHEFWLLQNSALPLLDDSFRMSLGEVLAKERFLVCSLPTPPVAPENDRLRCLQAGEAIRESFLSELSPDVVLVTSLFEGADSSPAYTSIGKFFPETPVACVFYDLIPLLNAETYLADPKISAWYYDKVASLQRADLLLSISDYARQEALEHIDVAADAIVSIGTSYDKNLFRCLEEDSATLLAQLGKKFGITKPYIMYNGALEPRKNLEGLVRAYALLPAALRATYVLVFVGAVKEHDIQRIREIAGKLGCGEHIILTNHVDDEDLVRLFNAASLFVFPSFHEGFGLPALEAMACGTPTIGSNCTSIPEVIGKEALLFDPHDPQDIANTISHVLSEQTDIRQLAQYSLARAAQFSWAKCAAIAMEALEALHGQRTQPRSDWAQSLTRRERGYRRLLEEIVALGADTTEHLKPLAACIAANRHVSDTIVRGQTLPARLRWRVEGPFDSNYSLALLNRETALALDALGHDVALHSTEGPGDFPPSIEFLEAHPTVASLYRKEPGLTPHEAHVTSRNLFPPRVADVTSRCNLLHHFAWEESGLPLPWVHDFNKSLQGITCLSTHVQKILIDNGVRVPLTVSGCGTDHWSRIAPQEFLFPNEVKRFRLLHVSSAFPRKGLDGLFQAYGRAFTATDDVSLVVKTFSNPHNKIYDWLEQARRDNPQYPHVYILEEDLEPGLLKGLVEQCQALVAPSRAEGFGLPLAEAILSGLPVITTAWGGQRDFCTADTAWLVDYTFKPAQSHFELFDSVWAEPDVEHLAHCMREVYSAPSSLKEGRNQKGRELLQQEFTWNRVAERLVAAARSSSLPKPQSAPRVGVVTTWEERCGIATYSEHLVRALPGSVSILASENKATGVTRFAGWDVVRCWQPVRDPLERLAETVEQKQLDTLIIQFNYYFFDFRSFAQFVDRQLAQGRVVVVLLHATNDPPGDPEKKLALLAPLLKRCHRLLVHSIADLNRLKALELVENVTLFPHGILDYPLSRPPQAQPERPFLLGSYGFFLPHKGLIQLIDAVALLRQRGLNVQLRMVNAEYPNTDSAQLVNEAAQRIQRAGLSDVCALHTDFLSDSQSLGLLEECDLIVFPYQHTGESASGAVRYGLTAGRPVAVTPLEIFSDVASIVHTLPGTDTEDIARGISDIIAGKTDCSQEALAQNADRWREAHRFSVLGNRLWNICGALRAQVDAAADQSPA